jgi:hypothetical protein
MVKFGSCYLEFEFFFGSCYLEFEIFFGFLLFGI